MLRHNIALQSRANTADGSGGYTTVWTTYATVGARLENVSGSERLHSQRLDAETTVKATIRYRSDITESDRVSFDGKVYQIRHIDNLEFRNRWLRISLGGGVAT